MRLSRALRIAPGDVLALIGGGGKTTAMFRLADELANTSSPKMRVLMTTSTRIFAVQIKLAPAYVTFDPQHQAVGDILPQLDAAVDKYGQVLLIGQTDSRSGKAFGIPPKSVDILAGTGHFDLIINEADGSRMRSFKAPADHEPVIPSCTTVVTPVVGLDVLGQPLTDETVHRANLVSKLSNTVLGQPVTADMIVAVVCHRDGGLKNIPTQARVVPLLNKVESPADLPVAQELATRLLACDRIEAVAIGAVQSTDRPIAAVINRTAAIILAAGGSSRFGSPKQLARWKEQTFLERAVDVALAARARPIIVVLGAETDQCHTILKDKPVQVAVNKDWASGQSSSMKAGLAALPPNVSSVVFQLVDLPGISPDTIDALIQRYRATLAPVVWPEFEGRRGNPVLFDRSLFPELMQVRGDTGGRPLLVAYQDQAERISVGDQGILIDIDRAEDLQKYST